MTRRGGQRDLRALLTQTLKKNRLMYGVDRARAVLLWPEVVGPDLARLTRARAQQRNVLFIEAQDSVLANFLTMQRHVFLQRLQDRMGDQSVTELRFSVGTWTQKIEARPAEPLPPPDKARAEEIVRDVPDAIRDSALKAAEAITRARLWREQQGWPKCPICGTHAETVPCVPCQNLLANPSIQAMAKALARTPEAYPQYVHDLGETAAEAARHLTLRTLAEQIDLLAVECARAGGATEYLQFLKAQADAYLSLWHRKPRTALTRDDLRALPERPRHVILAGR